MSEQKDVATIFVGKTKPLAAYINACSVAAKTSKQIKICGRGQVICDVVSIAEIFMRKIGKREYLAEVSSVEMQNKYGKTVFVSTMTVTITV